MKKSLFYVAISVGVTIMTASYYFACGVIALRYMIKDARTDPNQDLARAHDLVHS